MYCFILSISSEQVAAGAGLIAKLLISIIHLIYKAVLNVLIKDQLMFFIQLIAINMTRTHSNSDSRFIGQLDERLQNEFTKNLFQVIKSVQT